MDRLNPSDRRLAAQARALLRQHLVQCVPSLVEQVLAEVQAATAPPADVTDGAHWRDWQQRLVLAGPAWQQALVQRWQSPSPSARAVPAAGTVPTELALVGEETVETEILTARLALAVLDKAGGQFNDLRLRLQHLESVDDWDKDDPVQVAPLAQAVVDAWLAAGFTRQEWAWVQARVTRALAQAVAEAYEAVNHFLLQHGVLPEIDWRGLLRRSAEVARVPTERASSPPVAHPAAQIESGGLAAFLRERVPAVAAWWSSPHGAGAVAPGAVGDPHARADAVGTLPPVEPVVEWTSLESAAQGVRAQARAFKAAVASDEERAVIEVVALMFDSILGEERIPASLRVWFARLQMPVLRMAVSDPDFLVQAEHPARLLLDRLGVCVLGIDMAQSIEPLEQEIRRMVQMVEQYPEAGRRIFEVVYQEFQTFLATQWPLQLGWAPALDAAQRIEQRETLTVQYTIELRQRLGAAPVHEGLREFLFQVWTEVMAQAAVVHGVASAQAQDMRQVVVDLLWAASAKPTRSERAQVIARVPGLLARVRQGLTALGLSAEQQDGHLQLLNDVLAQAFVARTPSLDADWLQAVTASLSALEAVLPTDPVEGLELSRESLEMLTGLEVPDMVVLPNPEGHRPAMPAGVSLSPGAWFTLEHNGQAVTVQLVGASPQRQLYLFATPAQQLFLLPQGRVAHDLQSGWLLPREPEPLTERAARHALDRLQAQPERLLAC